MVRCLQLVNFKNYGTGRFNFSAHLNLITGQNGTGKTNLLDAIYIACNTKSAFLPSDILAIQHEQPFFRIEAHFTEKERDVKVECIVQKEEGKLFLADGKAPEKLSGYIGRFPVVMVNPYDTDLVREGSDIRRKFFDQILSQASSDYLDALLACNRLLKQRNALLKQFVASGRTNLSLLAIYDEQLIPLNTLLFRERAALLEQFLPLLRIAYQELADTAEQPGIHYHSHCTEPDFAALFYGNRQNDLAAQRTTTGVHLDDFEFLVNDMSLKRYGSQGQQKTFVLAMKLAHFASIVQLKKIKPILLLDDIFDRLDEQRMARLAGKIAARDFGQVFVTDASPRRVADLFGPAGENITHISTGGSGNDAAS